MGAPPRLSETLCPVAAGPGCGPILPLLAQPYLEQKKACSVLHIYPHPKNFKAGLSFQARACPPHHSHRQAEFHRGQDVGEAHGELGTEPGWVHGPGAVVWGSALTGRQAGSQLSGPVTASASAWDPSYITHGDKNPCLSLCVLCPCNSRVPCPLAG